MIYAVMPWRLKWRLRACEYGSRVTCGRPGGRLGLVACGGDLRGVWKAHGEGQCSAGDLS